VIYFSALSQVQISDSTKASKKPKPLIKELIDNTDPEVLFTGEKICDQKIFFLGKTKGKANKNSYYIVTVSTSWGASCKNTSRILVFDFGKKYLGNYYSEILPLSIQGDYLLFEGSEKSPNFTNHPPAKFSIAGIKLEFEKK
jgi:hypothetical protein